MLVKRRGSARPSLPAAALDGLASGALNRRSFLARSGLATAGVAALGTMQLGSVQKAKAAGSSVSGPEVIIRKNICTHCSVGCTVTAETVNGVWVGQEPSWESPINRGTHCCKGASIRELVHGDRRLRYPMKIVNGEWQRLSWDQAISEIAQKTTEINEKY